MRARARAGRLRSAVVSSCAAMTLLGAGVAPAQAQTSTDAVSLASAGTKTKVRFGHALRLSGVWPPALRSGSSSPLRAARGGPRARRSRSPARTASGSVAPAHSGAFRAAIAPARSRTRQVTVVARLAGHASRHVRTGTPCAYAAGSRRASPGARCGCSWRPARVAHGRPDAHGPRRPLHAIWHAAARAATGCASSSRATAATRPSAGRSVAV